MMETKNFDDYVANRLGKDKEEKIEKEALDEAIHQEKLREEIEKKIMSFVNDDSTLAYTDEGVRCMQNVILDICDKNNIKLPWETEWIEINNIPHMRVKLNDGSWSI